ncbi:MAG: hypothetical protein HXX13_09820 [Bacteroidetes bacterium]|nr:hypothetical protein [Bacteroidota bacterium]
MKSSGHYIFHEEQRFRQNWIMMLVLPIVAAGALLQVYGMYQQIYLGKPWGDNPTSNTALVIASTLVIVFLCLFFLVFLSLKLETEVRDSGFYYTFPPILNKVREIKKEDIEHYFVGKYNPIMEYGGWGIRIRPGKGRAFNVKGRMGVKIFLKNGKTVLFGTQDVKGMEQAMQRLMKPNNP